MHSNNRGKLHRYLYFIAVFLCFLPFWPILKYWSRNPDRYYTRFVKVRRRIAGLSSALVGFRYHIRYQHDIDWSKNYVICPNHSSNLDITAMSLAFRTDFSFMGKEELLRNPVTGIFFRTIDIPVNRKSKISGFRAFRRAAQYLKQGRSVLIFPEGQISDEYPPRIGDFKTGPFRLAVDENVPIIPVVIHNAWQLHWDDGSPRGSRPGTVYVDVLAPLKPNETPIAADKEAELQRLLALTYEQINTHWLQGWEAE